MKSVTTIVFASLIAAGLTLPLSLKADAWDKATTVTFSGPVEIPGQVLSAGTYVFKLLDTPGSRNVVQIFNANQTKLYATVLAIPDSRLKPTGKTVITFEERAANAPEAIQAWFYPGDNFGQEFVYPKPKAVQLAQTNNRPVPSMPANLVANTQMLAKAPTEPQVVALKQAPVKAQQATGEEVEVAEVFATPVTLLAQANPPAESQTPKTLPATASPLPSIALAGLMMGCLGLVLRFIAQRSSESCL
jgi:hypothetical protein